MPPSDLERARTTLDAVNAHMQSSLGLASQMWMRPWSDLFQLYGRVLSEPAPPIEQWPARALALSINAVSDSLAFQSAAFRTALAACNQLMGSLTRSGLELDTKSEAAGPIPVALFTGVAAKTPLVAEPLQMDGGTALIPAANIQVVWIDGQPAVQLVNLLALQPLPQGCYIGHLRNQAGVLVASIEARVVASIAR